MCPKLTELLSWNGPNVHVCCFMLTRASTKTFVSRVQKTEKKIFVSRKIRQQGHSLAEVLLYNTAPSRQPRFPHECLHTLQAFPNDSSDVTVIRYVEKYSEIFMEKKLIKPLTMEGADSFKKFVAIQHTSVELLLRKYRQVVDPSQFPTCPMKLSSLKIMIIVQCG